jgi:hypothetical protein
VSTPSKAHPAIEQNLTLTQEPAAPAMLKKMDDGTDIKEKKQKISVEISVSDKPKQPVISKEKTKTASKLVMEPLIKTPKSTTAKEPMSVRPRSAGPSPGAKFQRQRGEQPALVDKAGMVSFYISADESISELVPSLKRNRLSFKDDMTVFFIKRHIVDEVLPDVSATEIDIKTSTGILLGQDHSLRYIRTILWPPYKGDIDLKFSLGKGSLI